MKNPGKILILTAAAVLLGCLLWVCGYLEGRQVVDSDAQNAVSSGESVPVDVETTAPAQTTSVETSVPTTLATLAPETSAEATEQTVPPATQAPYRPKPTVPPATQPPAAAPTVPETVPPDNWETDEF